MEKFINDFSIGLFLWQLMVLLIAIGFIITMVFLIRRIFRMTRKMKY